MGGLINDGISKIRENKIIGLSIHKILGSSNRMPD
jgi:hypothetical protein